MSAFNPEQFMSTTTTDAHETKMIRIADGVYKGQISKVDYRTIAAKDANPERVIMEVTWDVLDEAVKKATGMAKPTVRQSIWLDIIDGKLETGPGKNIGLGQLREALGQNKPGKPWAPAHLNGGMATISVKAKLNKSDGESYPEVNKVAKV
jgi:hypothetical protein